MRQRSCSPNILEFFILDLMSYEVSLDIRMVLRIPIKAPLAQNYDCKLTIGPKKGCLTTQLNPRCCAGAPTALLAACALELGGANEPACLSWRAPVRTHSRCTVVLHGRAGGATTERHRGLQVP